MALRAGDTVTPYYKHSGIALPVVHRVLSLGAGVQSSTLYLMAVRGIFGADRPSVAVFADTQWEPAEVYTWLHELDTFGGASIPIERVTAGNIRQDALSDKRFASMPLYTAGVTKEGQLRRQCTREYKVAPVTKFIRRTVIGLAPRERIGKGERVELWMGISTDEATRMRDNREPWITNRYPLIERQMSRADCLAWLTEYGYPKPAKSACIGCPYTDIERWREMRAQRPAEFADAVEFDAAIRKHNKRNQSAYLHRSCLPLADAVLTAEERGQTNLFAYECEGMCGV